MLQEKIVKGGEFGFPTEVLVQIAYQQKYFDLLGLDTDPAE